MSRTDPHHAGSPVGHVWYLPPARRPDSQGLRVLRTFNDANLVRLSEIARVRAAECRDSCDRGQATFFDSVGYLADLVRMERAIDMREAQIAVDDFCRRLGIEL
jgi:hypothetical protein